MLLRGEVLESEYLMQAALMHMQACGSLYSHPEADIEKGSVEVNRMYYNSIAKVPYMTAGKSGDDMIEEDRKKLIDRYMKMKDNLTPKKDAKA